MLPGVASAGTFDLASNKHPDGIIVGLVSMYIRECVVTASPYLGVVVNRVLQGDGK